jgi:hypothetical protein
MTTKLSQEIAKCSWGGKPALAENYYLWYRAHLDFSMASEKISNEKLCKRLKYLSHLKFSCLEN